MPVISVRNLVKTYTVGEVIVRALRGADLDVEAGEFVAVTGPSGSGKSTLMHILGCLDRPTSGNYFLDGKDVSRMSKDELAIVRNKKIGFVFQGFNLLSRTTALDNVELPLLYNGGSKMKSSERHRRAMDALKTVGLGERFHHFPNQLSGGQQQRVAIARSLINEPSIILADEPTGNLDTRTSIEVMDIFQKLNRERGITIILITHEMDIAEHGTRLVRFRDGKIQIDQKIAKRRNAGDELAALPPPDEDVDTPPVPADPSRPSARRRRLGDHHVHNHDAAHRAQGAQPQQDAHRADHAGHDHRRRRGHHHGRARARRAGDHRGTGQVRRHQRHQHQRRQLHAGRRPAGPGHVELAHRGRRHCPAPGPRHPVRVGRRQLARADHRRQPELVQPDSGRRRRPAGDSKLADQVRELLHGTGRHAARPRSPSSGTVVAETLFGPDVDPTGEIIRIRNQPFKVIGVMTSKGQGAFGQDQDDTVFAPYTTVQKKLQGQTHINNITVASETPDTAPVAAAISEALRLRHKLVAGDPDDFTVRTQEEIASLRTETTRTMTVLLAAIAGVSLVVGGIGIMNIMLVSVTERTREIGLRMAIGARGRDVLLQFLVEAVVISLFGGLIGIGLGFALSMGIERFAAWPTSIPADWIAVAFGVAAATGVFFGFYPARKAARLDPIEALRFE